MPVLALPDESLLLALSFLSSYGRIRSLWASSPALLRSVVRSFKRQFGQDMCLCDIEPGDEDIGCCGDAASEREVAERRRFTTIGFLLKNSRTALRPRRLAVRGAIIGRCDDYLDSWARAGFLRRLRVLDGSGGPHGCHGASIGVAMGLHLERWARERRGDGDFNDDVSEAGSSASGGRRILRRGTSLDGVAATSLQPGRQFKAAPNDAGGRGGGPPLRVERLPAAMRGTWGVAHHFGGLFEPGEEHSYDALGRFRYCFADGTLRASGVVSSFVPLSPPRGDASGGSVEWWAMTLCWDEMPQDVGVCVRFVRRTRQQGQQQQQQQQQRWQKAELEQGLEEEGWSSSRHRWADVGEITELHVMHHVEMKSFLGREVAAAREEAEERSDRPFGVSGGGGSYGGGGGDNGDLEYSAQHQRDLWRQRSIERASSSPPVDSDENDEDDGTPRESATLAAAAAEKDMRSSTPSSPMSPSSPQSTTLLSSSSSSSLIMGTARVDEMDHHHGLEDDEEEDDRWDPVATLLADPDFLRAERAPRSPRQLEQEQVKVQNNDVDEDKDHPFPNWCRGVSVPGDGTGGAAFDPQQQTTVDPAAIAFERHGVICGRWKRP